MSRGLPIFFSISQKCQAIGNNHIEIYDDYIITYVYWTEFAYCSGFIPFVAIIGWLIFVF